MYFHTDFCVSAAHSREDYDQVLERIDQESGERGLVVFSTPLASVLGGAWLICPKQRCPGSLTRQRIESNNATPASRSVRKSTIAAWRLPACTRSARLSASTAA